MSSERARLDQVLVDELERAGYADFSRSRIQRLVEGGHVIVNGQVARQSHRLRSGDEVVVSVPPAQEILAVPQQMSLDILHEDDQIVVVNKPAGLVVHPGPGHADGTLVNGLLHHCRELSGIGGMLRPGIVHRLDKDTSGLLVACKTDRAHQRLALGFANKCHERRYVAIVSPQPEFEFRRIETLYGRHPNHRKKFSSRVTRGKTAVTEVTVIEGFGVAALVRCELQTGRTHQIRVHCAEHRFPVLADALYGKSPRDSRVETIANNLGRQGLHAQTLGFEHPTTGVTLSFSAPVPPDMELALEQLRALS